MAAFTSKQPRVVLATTNTFEHSFHLSEQKESTDCSEIRRFLLLSSVLKQFSAIERKDAPTTFL